MPTRRLFIALAATAIVGAAPAAFAHGSLVDVTLVDRERAQTLPTYRYHGAAWVAGQPGSRYAVRMSNRSGQRVLVVLSIDGVNAVSGETAGPGQTGYVLGPWQTAEITGWRKSMTEAAAFYFTSLPDSYAARTGRPDNVGVIGVAVFREREREPAPEIASRSDAAPTESAAAQGRSSRDQPNNAAGAPAAKAATRDERLGTGHGEREYAPTTHTSFDRASDRPDEIVRVQYDSAENLVASGVIPRPRRAPIVPEPFPGFVPDPRG